MEKLKLKAILLLLVFGIGVVMAVFLYFGKPQAIPFSPSKQIRYFPNSVFSNNAWSDQFTSDWYSSHLSAMHEPSLLFLKNHNEETYRFLWLRSFHHPVMVRLQHSGEKRLLIVKQLSGAGGYNPGSLTINQTCEISQNEWDNFLFLLKQTSFWSLPTNEEDTGKDGAQWILEGSKQGQYHIVDRWSPKDGKYRECCIYLLKISKLSIDLSGREVY